MWVNSPPATVFLTPLPVLSPPAQLQMETVAPVLDVVNNHPYILLTSVILGCATLVRLTRWRSHPHLPPGPKGLPIVGNLFDLTTTHVWEQFGAWGKQYGPFSPSSLPSSQNLHFDVNVCPSDCISRGRRIHQRTGSAHGNTQLV